MSDLALQVILIKGDPNGIKKVRLDNWNGQAFIFPRAEIGSLKEFSEINGSALYFLFGENEKEEAAVYIGESNKCCNRLDSHGSSKDFWDIGFVFLDPPNRKALETLCGLKWLEKQNDLKLKIQLHQAKKTKTILVKQQIKII
jgi:hypothetical protein